MNGQCQTDCGTGADVVSHVRRSSSVSAEAFALDQKVSVAAGTEGMSSKVLYFKHGYSAAATASVDTLFDPSMQQHELGNWTDVYVSATLSDHCGGDVWTAPSAGAYCTGTQLNATSSGVRCCTNKYGKQMLLRVCTRSVSGSEVCVTGGFKTRSSARSQVGEFVCEIATLGFEKLTLHTRISTSHFV